MNLIKVSPLQIAKRTAKAVLVLQDRIEYTRNDGENCITKRLRWESCEVWFPLSQVAIEGNLVVAVADWVRVKNKTPRDWKGFLAKTSHLSFDKMEAQVKNPAMWLYEAKV